MTRITMKSAALALSVMLLATSSFGLQKEEWQIGIDWASGNTGVPDCPEQYVILGMNDCLLNGFVGLGNRACVIAKARYLANQGLDEAALPLVAITQCHNPRIEQQTWDAGAKAVGDYL